MPKGGTSYPLPQNKGKKRSGGKKGKKKMGGY